MVDGISAGKRAKAVFGSWGCGGFVGTWGINITLVNIK